MRTASYADTDPVFGGTHGEFFGAELYRCDIAGL